MSQDEIIQDKMRKVRGWGQISPWEGLEVLLVPSPTSAGTLSLSADQVQSTVDNVLWLLTTTATKLMNLWSRASLNQHCHALLPLRYSVYKYSTDH